MSIITQIESFLSEHQMAPATFGKLALNDPALVIGLKNGRDLRQSTVERLQRFMREYESNTVGRDNHHAQGAAEQTSTNP
jgi:predicted transcriptional regulator